MYTQNTLSNKKTKTEISDLKREWDSNPNWDLCNSPGFEGHERELRKYQEDKRKKWEEAKTRRIRMAARSMGITVDMYKRWKELKNLADSQRQQSIHLMLNLIYDTHNVDDEMRLNVEFIVDSLFRGAINFAKAEMIQDKYAIP